MSHVKGSDRTNVILVVDESGSMQPFKRQVIEQFNKQYDAIPVGNKVTILTFDGGTVKEIPGKLTAENYRPNSATPLWDAVHRALDLFDQEPIPTLIAVLTDGEENSSHRTAVSTASRIMSAQATDLVTLAFMVPPGYKAKLVRLLGVHEGNVMEWEQTAAGFDYGTRQTYEGTQSYFTERARGTTSVKTFYTNAAGITAKDISQLQPRNDARVLPVPMEAEIRPFVEARGFPYVVGNAAYQLTKNELVQAGKQLFLMEKGKKTVYSGDVRGLLGLPAHTDVKVTPGNHAGYDIFVQSTSVNRKLVRGSKLVVFV